MKLKAKQIDKNVVDFITVPFTVTSRSSLVNVVSELSSALASVSSASPVAISSSIDVEGFIANQTFTIVDTLKKINAVSEFGQDVVAYLDEPLPGNILLNVRSREGSVAIIPPGDYEARVPYRFTFGNWTINTQNPFGEVPATSIRPVYYDGTSYVDASASTFATLAKFIELDNGTRINRGRVLFPNHGFSNGTYYLSATAGAVSATKPTTGFDQPLFSVEEPNSIYVNIPEVYVSPDTTRRIIAGTINLGDVGGSTGASGNSLSVTGTNITSAVIFSQNESFTRVRITHEPIATTAIHSVTIQNTGQSNASNDIRQPVVDIINETTTDIVLFELFPVLQSVRINFFVCEALEDIFIHRPSEASVALVDDHFSYSTTETKTGEVWIDGKEIYKRTLVDGNAPATATATFGPPLTNADKVIAIKGFTQDENNVFIPLPNGSATFSFRDSDKQILQETSGTALGTSSTITVYYTKNEVFTRFVGSISPASLPLRANEITEITLVVTGGTGPYTFEVIEGRLPIGMTLYQDKIVGAPTNSGEVYSFTIRATDSTSAVFDQGFIGFVNVDWTSESDFDQRITKTNPQENEGFGSKVVASADGNRVVAVSGGFNTESVMLIFDRQSNNTFTEDAAFVVGQKLIPVGAELPIGVAISGDGSTIAVAMDTGVTKIYANSLGYWALEQELSTPSPRSVALSFNGDTLAYGSGINNAGFSSGGRVEIFTRTSGVWTSQQSIEGNVNNGRLGRRVRFSADGNRLLVGGGYSNASSTLFPYNLFERTSGTWSLIRQFSFSTSDPAAEVAISGDGRIVAAAQPRFDASGKTDSGRVIITENTSGTTWVQRAELIDFESGEEAGNRALVMSNDGSVIAISADSSSTLGSTGGFYVFLRNGNTYQEATRISSTTGNDVDLAMDENGNTIMVGEPITAVNGVAAAGAVFKYGL